MQFARNEMPDAKRDLRVAVLSDTHGLLRPAVAARIVGVDYILHAGDVGDPAILDRLRQFAPVTAIRGNVDTHGPCALLPTTGMIRLANVLIYLVHSVGDLDIDPAAAGVKLVVSGHSHKPSLTTTRGVTYLNPGSVGPRRFQLPVAMAFLRIRVDTFTIEQIALDPAS